MTRVPDSWFTGDRAIELDGMRQQARVKWRIPYDCMSAVVKVGERVCCEKGTAINPNSPDSCLGLGSVLRGRSCSACKECEYYDPDDDEE